MSFERTIGTARIELVQGDITRQTTDAITNAANSSLLGGGGVDGAIHRAGGPAILEACKVIRAARGPLPPGEAVLTTAGRLKNRAVIHTVGPIWRGGDAKEAETLARCYRNSMALAAQNGLHTIAFPSISTGAYGYPVDQAAAVALSTVRQVLEAGSPVTLVRFVLWSSADLEIYGRALKTLADPSPS